LNFNFILSKRAGLSIVCPSRIIVL